MIKDVPAFELDTRIQIKIERELAAFVGGLILDSNTKNTAVIAFGHQLRRLSETKTNPETTTSDVV
jgi:hypothetical protein